MQPDVLVSAQYQGMQRTRTLGPEKSLWRGSLAEEESQAPSVIAFSARSRKPIRFPVTVAAYWTKVQCKRFLNLAKRLSFVAVGKPHRRPSWLPKLFLRLMGKAVALDRSKRKKQWIAC